jgi:hypothetical protein
MYKLASSQMSFNHYLYDQVIDSDNKLMRIRSLFPFAEIAEQFSHEFYSTLTGRSCKAIEVMIGLHLLKSWTDGLSDEKLLAQAKTDLLFKAFLGLPPDDNSELPRNASSLTHFRKRIGLKGQKTIDDAVLATMKKAGLVKGKKVASDTTAITVRIPHPTDTGLVMSMIKGLGNAVRKANPTGYIQKIVGKLTKGAEKIYKKWILFERKGKEEAHACLRELYGEGEKLLGIAKRVQTKVRKELRQTIGRTKGKGVLAKNREYQAKKKHLEQLNQHIELSEKVLEQTKKKLAGEKKIPDRIINYFLPSLRAIKRGKVGKLCEFGLKIFLNYEGGLIVGIDKVEGNANENKCVEKSIETHKKNFGHLPQSYTYDRGCTSDTLIEEMESKGVAMISPSRKGKKARKHEKTQIGKKRLRERSAVEAKIGEGKRCHGWKDIKYRSEETILMGVCNGATVMNLKKMVRLLE